MIPIYGIDENGYYIPGNDAWMLNGDTPPPFYVEAQPPSGFLHPRYVNGQWIDEAPPEPPPSDAECIELLQTSVTQLTQRVTDLEELLEAMNARIEALENPPV